MSFQRYSEFQIFARTWLRLDTSATMQAGKQEQQLLESIQSNMIEEASCSVSEIGSRLVQEEQTMKEGEFLSNDKWATILHLYHFFINLYMIFILSKT